MKNHWLLIIHWTIFMFRDGMDKEELDCKDVKLEF